jgi:hypothetical protein
VKFNEKEGAFYIIDYGKAEIRRTLPTGPPLPMPVVWPYGNGGVVWKVTKIGGAATTATFIPPPAAGATQSKPPPIAGIPELPPAG